MKIRTKLIFAFLLLGIAAMAISILAERPIRAKLSTLGDFHAPVLFAIQSIESDLKGAIEESFAYVVSGVEEERDEFLEWQRGFDNDIARLEELLEQMDLPEEQDALEAALLESILDGQHALAAAAQAMFDEYEATGAVSREAFDTYEEGIDELVPNVEAFVAIEKAELDEAHALALETIEESRGLILIWGAVVLALAAAIGVFLAELIRRPIEELVRVSNEVGRGSLEPRADVRSGDELGQLGRTFNQMISNLSEKTTSLDNLNRESEQRKQAEEELRDQHDRVVAILNALPDMLFEVDSEGRVLDFRTPSSEMLYSAPEEFVGKPVSEVLPADAAAVIMQGIDEASRTGAHRGGSFSLDMPQGETWYELSIAVRGKEGSNARYVALVRDITDRTKAESEKLNLERQIQHTQKLESLGVLAGGIAHDFNNLLVGILGNTDLALSDLPGESPVRAYLEEVEKASKRAADLSNQMLAYSGKGRFIVAPIEINQIIEEMAFLLEASTLKSAFLRYELAENLPSFNGDPTQIRQVIMNLITNASESIGDTDGIITLSSGLLRYDASEQEGVEDLIADGLVEPMSDGDYIYLGVSDTGHGMDQETVERIFDPFFTTKFTGRGLGMSAVLGIVRGHKGSLRIESQPGEGTVFEVFFPVNAPNVIKAASNVGRPDVSNGWSGTGTVLIVDDEEIVLRVGQKMLERIGFNVLTASDGRQALNLYRERMDDIHCVLLDLTMPHMDGEETFAELQKIDPNVTVLLCSGFNEQDVAQRFAEQAPIGFVQKPYKLSELRDKLKSVLEPKNGGS